MTESPIRLSLVPAEDEPVDVIALESLRSKFEGLLNQPTRFRETLPQSLLGLSWLGVMGSALIPGAAMGSILGVISPLIGALTTAVGTGLGAWLQSRNGRKIRIKVGDIEAEARTTEEVIELLARAQEIKRENEPRQIRER